MKKDVRYHVGVIIDTLGVIEEYTPESKEKFVNDTQVQDATLMRLLQAGEHLVKVRQNFSDFYQQHQTEEWHKLIGLRNIIAHGYQEVDMEIVWNILDQEVKDLNQSMQVLADQLGVEY